MKKEIKSTELQGNVCQMIGKDWMLITAGDENKHNTMTAAWGGLGTLWNMDVAYIFIRDQRYTKQFVENSDTFSLTFFDEEWRKQLSYLGTVSGRDENKIEKAGLTVEFIDGTPAFKEAKTTIICRKIYQHKFDEPSFVDKSIREKWYDDGTWHTMYIGKIEKVLVEE